MSLYFPGSQTGIVYIVAKTLCCSTEILTYLKFNLVVRYYFDACDISTSVCDKFLNVHHKRLFETIAGTGALGISRK